MEKELIIFQGKDEILWKSPINSLSYNAQVNVPFTHCALFVVNGQIIETLEYSSVPYVLNEKSHNYFGRALKHKNDKIENCQMYYVCVSQSKVGFWGTSSAITIFDNVLNMPVEFGLHGRYEISISNPRKFTSKVCGGAENVTIESVNGFFKNKIVSEVTSQIAQAMLEPGQSIFTITSKFKEICLKSKANAIEALAEYGVKLVDLFIEGLQINQECRKAINKVIDSGNVRVNKIQAEITADVSTLASGEVASQEADLPRFTVPGAYKSTGSEGVELSKRFCTECGCENATTAKFCGRCGTKLN